jgi:hypothetical protein
MVLSDATDRVKNCFNGEAASCSYACPFRFDIRSFAEKAAAGRWLPAYKLLRNALVFPVTASALCGEPCMRHCQREDYGGSIALRELERAVLRLTKSRGPENFAIPLKPERIAVDGANLFGLSAALSLSQKGYDVTVFDCADGWLSELRAHSMFAEFEADVALQFSGQRCEFMFGVPAPESGYSYIVHQPSEQLPHALLIAKGQDEALRAEAFIQTGTARLLKASDDVYKCDRYLSHDGEEQIQCVEPADPALGYTAEEAGSEAARCFR